ALRSRSARPEARDRAVAERPRANAGVGRRVPARQAVLARQFRFARRRWDLRGERLRRARHRAEADERDRAELSRATPAAAARMRKVSTWCPRRAVPRARSATTRGRAAG